MRDELAELGLDVGVGRLDVVRRVRVHDHGDAGATRDLSRDIGGGRVGHEVHIRRTATPRRVELVLGAHAVAAPVGAEHRDGRGGGSHPSILLQAAGRSPACGRTRRVAPVRLRWIRLPLSVARRMRRIVRSATLDHRPDVQRSSERRGAGSACRGGGRGDRRRDHLRRRQHGRHPRRDRRGRGLRSAAGSAHPP